MRIFLFKKQSQKLETSIIKRGQTLFLDFRLMNFLEALPARDGIQIKVEFKNASWNLFFNFVQVRNLLLFYALRKV
jgi:hypothetical protein